MNTQEFIKELETRGFKEFAPTDVISKGATRAFQKRISDKSGIKYFITCYFYSGDRIPHPSYTDGFEFNLQFNKIHKNREYTVNTLVFSFFDYDSETETKSFYPVEEIEELVEDMWTKMNYTYYERYS